MARVLLEHAGLCCHEIRLLVKCHRVLDDVSGPWLCSAGHHDKDTLIGTAIAELLFPEAQYRPEGMPYEDYAELARRSYQKHYTSVLRAAAPITEVCTVCTL